MNEHDEMLKRIASLTDGELVFFLCKKDELKPEVYELYAEEAVGRGLIVDASEFERMRDNQRRKFVNFFSGR
ncbi:hypothetical protein WKV44_03405 [Spirochaetia bacterium 38H-sp]|uniref:Uncharacterized protein n=1 Tax=Rarispira pelagica TaxID=3141764 RepID=A0ABU9UA90_9SPIR